MPRVANPRPAIGRLGQAAQNALEVARFGGLQTDEEPSPHAVAHAGRVFRLKRYFPDARAAGAPVVLVPPMMLAADVYDVSPSSSAVRILADHGADPWVVDFGAPEREEGGLQRTLADHVLAVSEAVDRVREATGRDVHLGGYSQGGMFCYQTAAYRRSEGLASVIGFGSPVDLRGAVPLGLPEEIAARGGVLLAETLFRTRALPAWASRLGFRMLDPVKAVRQQLEFVLQLHDREALLPRERQRRFLQAEGWVAWPGPALADFMRQFVEHNRMLQGGFVIEDRLVTLADIACPVLVFVGSVDEIAPAPAVRAITQAAPRADVHEVELRAGHFGLVVGSASTVTTWPVVARWARWVDEGEPLPPEVRPAGAPDTPLADDPGVLGRVGHGLELAAGVGVSLARNAVETPVRALDAARVLTAEAAEQLPRLVRLDSVRPRTRISLGLLLDEQAEEASEGISFLFEDRAHTHAAAKRRIDAVVRGFLSIGVRQGEHVGVLMDMRPSALVTVAALNRLGAVAVLMRPDGEIAREAELGQIGRVVCDPERIAEAQEAGVQVLVLGGGGGPRNLGRDVVDMERIDPDTVVPPRWYRPNPGRARDLAFILFTGEGARTRVNRITNRRWVLSAVGTASSASLSPADTVYSVTPIYHPSSLLQTLGGAIAGGARIAMARRFEPETFWEETRRYGVTVASYTWTMLRSLVEAPPQPGERGHPLRLFIGSGMPPYLWRRVTERFAPARVVEFYASTEGEAILVNLTGAKVGAMGRRLPGSARVRIAAWDAERERLVTGDDGFAVRVPRGEPGMLLAAVDPDAGLVPGAPLRGVFRRDDAWVATGDLFRCDEDGDHWLVDPVGSLLRTERGVVPPSAIRNALGELDAVSLVVAYAVRPEGAAHDLAVAAVALREGRSLDAAEVTEALNRLPPRHRPTVVRVVRDIPVTTWYRPVVGPLRAEGIPATTARHPVFVRDPARAAYRPLTKAARERLLAA